jgi:4,5-DOPA dioxygenase extradiol
VRVTSSDRMRVAHDFSGFPPALDELDYPAPGAPKLSQRIIDLLGRAGIAAATDPSHPLDHGVWVPLRFLYPSADVPIVEISQPVPRTPEEVSRIGRALAPLRDDGVLLLATGGLVHNLLRVRSRERKAPVDGWARMFEEWVIDRLKVRDLESLFAYRRNAPGAPLAAPTPEHFDPLFFVAGATDERDRLETIYEGFEYGNLSMRVVAFVPAAPVERPQGAPLRT